MYRCLAFENSDLTYLKAFDDSIIYRLAWEKEQENVLKEAEDLETITMISSRKEKYVCILPKMMEKKQVILQASYFMPICSSFGLFIHWSVCEIKLKIFYVWIFYSFN